MTFNFGSAVVCSPAICEICVAIFFESYSQVDKFYRFIIFSLLIDAFILILNNCFNTLSLHTSSKTIFGL